MIAKVQRHIDPRPFIPDDRRLSFEAFADEDKRSAAPFAARAKKSAPPVTQGAL
jgi:hypothetical protein